MTTPEDESFEAQQTERAQRTWFDSSGGEHVASELELGLIAASEADREEISSLRRQRDELLGVAKEALMEFEAWDPTPDDPSFHLIITLRAILAAAKSEAKQ